MGKVVPRLAENRVTTPGNALAPLRRFNKSEILEAQHEITQENSIRLAIGLGMALTARGAFGQTAYPCTTLKIVSPYPPGGTTDILSRLLAPGQRLSAGNQREPVDGVDQEQSPQLQLCIWRQR